MSTIQNPILEFRVEVEEKLIEIHQQTISDDLKVGKLNGVIPAEITHTMITKTREAADSSESSF